MTISLSKYLPPDTTYFYGYPAGTDSTFYNCVPPAIEELVSARPLVCAGPNLRVVAFSATTRADMLQLLRETGVDVIPDERIIRLPEEISIGVTGERRNATIVEALATCVPDGTLIMAQPYDRDVLHRKYRIPIERALAMNDKRSMRTWVPSSLLPRTLAEFADGPSFARCDIPPPPCVIKVASSSSGDGVRVCRTLGDIAVAREAFAQVCEPIFVQEYIDAVENIGVQFGIPADPALPIDIIGMSRQITSREGEFLGGVVLNDDEVPQELATALRETILPAIRRRGWYGVGGIDVLRNAEGRYYIIDPNLRMTAMSAAVYASEQAVGRRNMMLSMTAHFRGRDADLIRFARAGTADQLFRLIAVRRDDGGLQFNGTLLFDQAETLRENAVRALRNGFDSTLLRAFADRGASVTMPSAV